MKYLNKIIEYGILLLIFLIPWQARWILTPGELNGGYWEYGTQALYATEILLAVILALVIVSSWSPAFLRGDRIHLSFFKWILSAARKAASRMTTPAGVLFLFLIYAGLSVFWSIDKNTALIHWRWLVEAGVVMVLIGWFVETRYVASHGNRGQNETPGMASLHWAIILSAVIQAGWGITQFLTQSIPASTVLGMAQQGAEVLGASVVETLDGRWLRAYGTFSHPNMLGGWLVLGLIITIRKIQETRYKQIQISNIQLLFLYASFVVVLFGLLTTFSRSAWLAFWVFMLLAILLSLRAKSLTRDKLRNDIFKLFAITILSVVIFNSLFPNLLSARADSQNRLEAKATSERLAGFNQSWQIIKNHPLIGVGIGNYGLAGHRDIDNTKPAWYYQPSHNVLLLVWSELGIIGLLLAFYFLFSIFLNSQNRRNLILYLLPLLVISLFDHYLWSLYSGLMIGAVYLANISRK